MTTDVRSILASNHQEFPEPSKLFQGLPNVKKVLEGCSWNSVVV